MTQPRESKLTTTKDIFLTIRKGDRTILEVSEHTGMLVVPFLVAIAILTLTFGFGGGFSWPMVALAGVFLPVSFVMAGVFYYITRKGVW